MCDCFHLAFPNWQAASSGTAGRRLRAPEPNTEDDSTCDEPSQFTERPRPQGSSPVEEYPETEKYSDSDRECEAAHDPHLKRGSGKKTKKSGLGSMFEKRSTPKMSKLKEDHSPESGVIVKTAQGGCAEGLVYGGGGKEGIFITEVIPESPASKNLELKEGDQLLSATVYFDDVSYEDAIQILEHARAYKVKLCLKRKPDVTETESAIESNIIPEEDVYAPEMREQGKTKSRAEARISWPKFPSFGKGRKSRFTRSHSSSEADEQRKLELSPTTSDTESPIKSQDALKGKKKHKIKLSGLKKRGRVSSSEDQDTDAPASAQMASPECLESPSGETPQVYVTDDPKVVEDVRLDQEPQSVSHKVELITIASTLKTEDLTVALAGKEDPSGIKSPDGKKKKRELSQLKMKILGKDKSHKKDTKAKSSPKRLRTLGASIEKADKPEMGKSESHTNLLGSQVDDDNQVIKMSVSKGELEISDVALIQKSPQKGREKTNKGKDVNPKQETKKDSTFKLPKIGFSDIANEETITKINANVEEFTTKIEKHRAEVSEVKEDPYQRLSKSFSTTKLPKREDIEIPGMEDMSKRTRAKRIKEPKTVFTKHYEDIQAETVQMSIDVDRVKEAVSKLPGFKLPKVDTSGMPIPEEITVIDANAQRISVKTPTKTKHDAPLSKFDATASPDVSNTTIKLPKIKAADLALEEILTVTQVDSKKPGKEYEAEPNNKSDEDVYKREHIIIPGKESAQEEAILQTQETQGLEGIKSEYPSAATFKTKGGKITMPSFGIAKPDIKIPDVAIYLPKQNISEETVDNIKGERTIFLPGEETPKTETRNEIEGVTLDVKIPEMEGIEYIDSVEGSPAIKDGGVKLSSFGVNINAHIPKAHLPCADVGEVKFDESRKETFKLPKIGEGTPDISVNVPQANEDIKMDGAGLKSLKMGEKGVEFHLPNLCISMPEVKASKVDSSVSKKYFTISEAKAEVKLPAALDSDTTLLTIDAAHPEQKMDVQKVRPLRTEGEFYGEEGKFKMSGCGVKIPEIQEYDLGLSKKDVDVILPQANAIVKLPHVENTESGIKVEGKAPEIAVCEQDIERSTSTFKMPTFKLPTVGVGTPNMVVEVSDTDKDVKLDGADIDRPAVNIEAPSVEIEGQSIDMKATRVPHLKFPMPKVKGPQINLSSTKKVVDVTLPETSAKIKLPKAPQIDTSHAKEVLIPERKVQVKESDLEMKPLQSDVEIDRQRSKLKMPKLGMSMPKVKGPEITFGLSKKDLNVTLGEAKTEVKVPEIETKEPSAKVEIKAPKKSTEVSQSKFKMPTFKLPEIGVGTPNISVEVPEMDQDVKIDGAAINDEGSAVNITAPSIDIEGPSMDMKTTGAEQEKIGSKYKMPHLGFAMPKVKGPKIDLSLPEKDIDVKLPATKVDAKIDLEKVDVSIPEAKMEMTRPDTEMHFVQSEDKLDGKEEALKIPKFGIKMKKVKGPEFDWSSSKKDINVPQQQITVEVKHPEAPKIHASLGKAEVLIPGAKMEVENPKMEINQTRRELEEQRGKFQMPKFGITIPEVKGPVIDLSFSKKDVDVTLPQAEAEVELPEAPKIAMDIKPAECEAEIDGRGGKLKMPKFGISMPKIKGPEIDLSSSKKYVDISLPDAKGEVNLPHMELQETSTEVDIRAPEIDGQTSSVKESTSTFRLPTFKFPKFGAATHNISIEETSAGGEIEPPEIKVGTNGTDGSPSKFKMATFKLPKIGVETPSATIEMVDKEVDIKIPEEVLAVDVAAHSIDIEDSIKLKGKGSEFKLPSLSFSGPQIKRPETDLSLSKQNVDVTLPDPKADVKLPNVELKEMSAEVEMNAPEIKIGTKGTDGSPSKYKMPTFKFPKFGFGTSSVTTKVPDKDVTIEGADINISKQVPEIDMAAPSIDIKDPSIELEAKGSKFKLPGLGISGPQIQRAEIDLSISKKDVDVTLPEAKGDVKLPDVELKGTSAEVEIKAPEIKIGTKGGSPSKYKMPTFKLPKIGVGTPRATIEAPDLDGDINIDGADIKVPEEVLAVDIAAHSIDIEEPSIELEGKGSEFKLPSFSFSGPQIKRPETDLSLSKQNVDVTLPDPKTDVKLPNVELKEMSAEVKINAPEIKIGTKGTDGSPSKYKMPTFKFPKFGFGTSSVTTEVADKDVTIEGAEINISKQVPEIDIAAPSIDIKDPSIELKAKGSKFKLPGLGISGPQIQRAGTDFSLSKKDVDVTLPEAKGDVKLPDVELKGTSAEVEIKAPEIKIGTKGGSPSKYKMPTFKLPKIGVGTPRATIEAPDLDGDINIDGADIKIPEEVLAVDVAAHSIDIEDPSIELEGKGSEFKLPSLSFSGPQIKRPETDLSLSKKNVDVTLPDPKADVKLPNVELKEISAEVKINAPEIKIGTKGTDGSPSKYKMPTFKFPKFGFGTSSVTTEVPDKDVTIEGAEINISKQVPEIDIAAPSIDIKDPSIELEAKGSKFKLPGLGISGPQIQRAEIDLSLSKKDVDVTLPEAKGDVKLPDVELKGTSAEVEIKAPEIKIGTKGGSPSKYKMPTFKLPKIGVGTPRATIEAPDLDGDINIDGADIKIPEEVLAVDIAAHSIDIEEPSIELEGKGSKFKLPSFSFSGPLIERPETDLSLSKKNVDVTLPDPKADVKLPNVELKEISAEVKINAPEIKIGTKGTDGSPSKYKMPTFKFPKFGFGTSSVTTEVPDKDVTIEGAEINISKQVPEIDIAAPSIDIKDPLIELEAKGSKFKIPGLGISGPQIQRAEIDLSLSKKDVDVTLPEAKGDVKLPDVELKGTSAEVEIKAPEIKIGTKGGSPSKYKMPTFKLPKIGVGTPRATIEAPDLDGDINIDGADIKIPEEVLAVDIAAHSIDIEEPSIELEGKGSKFKLPSFSFSGPLIKRPETDLSLSKKNVDVTLPDPKADVKLPNVELKEISAEVKINAPEIKIGTKGTDGSPSKYKMPTFKFPKFGFGTSSVTTEVPDKDVTIEGAEINISKQVPEIDIAAPSIDIKDPSIELEAKGSKFKLPGLGISGPQIQRAEIDLSLSKKDVNVTLPEAKGDVKLPDVELKGTSAEVEIKAPEIKIGTKGGSPSKYKMPTFKLPKIGVGTPRATIEAPDLDGDINIDGADIKIPEEVLAVDIAAHSIDIEEPSIELEGKGSKFKLPSFSFSGPLIKRPETDLSLSKKNVDVTLPDPKADVKLPNVELKEISAEVKINAPEIKIGTKGTDGSPSKYKMPTFKFPKFGFGTSSVTTEVPDKDVTIEGAEINISKQVPEIDIAAPSIDIKDPSIELEAKGSKFKLPGLGISGPQIQRAEIDLSLSKKDVNVTLPEAKGDVKLPDVELKGTSAEVEIKAPEIKIGTKGGSPSKYKMPTFKLPKIGVGTPRATIEAPDLDGDINIDGADIKIPEEVLAVDIAAHSIDIEEPSIELEGKGSKFKLPSFSFSGPQIKRPETDLSVSKQSMDVTLPDPKADVKLPNVVLKETSAEVEMNAPEIKIGTKGTDGSPSKYKMPTFKFPKFGFGTSSVTTEVPDKDVKIEGADINISKQVPEIDIAAPSIDVKDLSIELEAKGSKFKLPGLGISGRQNQRAEIDLSISKKDVDVTLPEAKGDVKLPDVELKGTSAEVEIKAPEIKIGTKGGSPSKYKMPTFKLPKFGVGTPRATIEASDLDGDINIDGADIKIPEEVLAVDIAAHSIDIEEPSIELEGKGSKFKLPSFSFSGPQIKRPETDLSVSKQSIDVTLPDPKADVKLPNVELKEMSAEVKINAPEIKIGTKGTDGSPSKYKMPTFKFPKFGFGTPSIEVPEKETKIDGADFQVPEEVLAVDIAAPSINIKDPSIGIKTTATEPEGKGNKFKLPSLTFSGPQIKQSDIDKSLSRKDVDMTQPSAEVKLTGFKLKESSAEVEIKAPGIDVETSNVQGLSAKLKMPSFMLPKLGAPHFSVEVTDVNKDIQVDGANLKLPEVKAEVIPPDVGIKEPLGSNSALEADMIEGDAKLNKTSWTMPKFSFSKKSVKGPDADVNYNAPKVDVDEGDVELDRQESKLKMPKFGISIPKVKGPEIDLSLLKKDVAVTLPKTKAEAQLPDVEIKQPSATVEVKAAEIEAPTGNVEGSPSKHKMPKFTLPKFGDATSKVSVDVPDVDKKIKIGRATVDTNAPKIDGLSVDVKAEGSEVGGSGSKFKMPKFGISMPKVKGPVIDLSLLKTDVDVTLPEAKAEVKLPSVEVKEPEAFISTSDSPTVEVETKMKRSNWTFPSFSKTAGKIPDEDVDLEKPKVDVTSTESKADVPQPTGEILMEEPSVAEPDANVKKTFSKSSVKGPEVSAELSCVDISLPEGQVIVKQPEMQTKALAIEAELDKQESKFKFPKFGIALPKGKGPAEKLKTSQEDVVLLPKVKAEVKFPQTEATGEIKVSETEVKSKDAGGSPMKFKLPALKMPKFGAADYNVTVEAPDADKVDETDVAKLKEDVTVNIKGLSADIELDVHPAAITDSETPKIDIDAMGLGSPSKFKLPSFKMPKLSFSRTNPEDEHVPVHTETKEDQQEIKVEPKEEHKSPKVTFVLSEVLKNMDVEFDVAKTSENLETSKELHETDEPSGKREEASGKETKQDAVTSIEKTSWFKFPKFGLSSPSEPARTSERDERTGKRSPEGETLDEEISPSCSVESSDAFADISSAMTSERVCLSLSSPTKVTVKYSDPDPAAGIREMRGNIITSTTRAELISVEPNLPEKITILSSGVSSSSEDTLRLESGKIHVISSNIQGTPEAQRAKLLTAVQIQSAGGLPREPGADEAAHSSKQTVFERHFVTETSTERSESKETIVITKQITRRFDSSEPISGETASSVQRLRDSVHSDKMRFFDSTAE